MELKVFLAGKLKTFENYINALEKTGMTPVHTDVGTEVNVDDYDALLIPGGADVDPKFYGEKKSPLCFGVNEELDAWEIGLAKRFAAAGKPILGICRGCQVLNVAFGGTLVQHITGKVKHSSLTGDVVHPTKAEAGSWIAEVFGKTDVVTNSAHHQCVKDIAPGFAAVQHAEDGIIEAIVHDELPIWAVQWHPERMSYALRREDTENGELIFRFFCEKIAANKGE